MKKRIFITLFVLILAGLFTYWHIAVNHANNKPVCESGENLNAPIEIPNEYVVKYQELKDTNKPVIAMFYVDWCGYCRRFMPVFGELAKQYKDDFSFAVINCDSPENVDIVKEYHIAGFPSLFFIDNELKTSFVINQNASADKNIFIEELEKYKLFKQNIKNLTSK